jgi:hypothetical protein
MFAFSENNHNVWNIISGKSRKFRNYPAHFKLKLSFTFYVIIARTILTFSLELS